MPNIYERSEMKKSNDEILIVDPECAQVGYYVTESELVEMVEKQNHPEWWTQYYRNLLLERWNEKNNIET